MTVKLKMCKLSAEIMAKVAEFPDDLEEKDINQDYMNRIECLYDEIKEHLIKIKE